MIHMYQKGNKELAVLALYLGDYSAKFYLREISKASGLALRTTQRVLAGLESARIMKSDVRGKNKYFYLNLENIETKYMLLQAESQRTLAFLEKYPVFRTFLKEIKNETSPIIVFGSFAKFLAGKMSDVDILIIADEKIELPAHLLPNKIHEIYLSAGNLTKAYKAGETLIKKVEENHIILNNHSFFVDWMWNNHADAGQYEMVRRAKRRLKNDRA